MKRVYIYMVLLLCLVACQQEIPMVGLGVDDMYVVYRMKPLLLHPEYTGEQYEWRDMPSDSLLSTDHDYVFCKADTGTYYLSLSIIDTTNPVHQDITIVVREEEVAYSRYISKVYEYLPAPGQFVNVLPHYEEGNTAADMARKAQDCISGTNDGLISLGGFGGYVTFGFDHSVVNLLGQYDFKILGNSVYGTSAKKTDHGVGGSSEPGIVEVSFDKNQNGLPDDAWYELAGSAYHNAETKHHYRITYQRGDTVVWQDNTGGMGVIRKNSFHTQDYYPQWIANDTLSFTGTLLPPNAYDELGNGSYFLLYSFDWGYADNHPNDSTDLVSFDIDWAVDSEGQSVYLPCVDFIRVYTAENQVCGWLGETSTEIKRAEDLHIVE